MSRYYKDYGGYTGVNQSREQEEQDTELDETDVYDWVKLWERAQAGDLTVIRDFESLIDVNQSDNVRLTPKQVRFDKTLYYETKRLTPETIPICAPLYDNRIMRFDIDPNISDLIYESKYMREFTLHMREVLTKQGSKWPPPANAMGNLTNIIKKFYCALLHLDVSAMNSYSDSLTCKTMTSGATVQTLTYELANPADIYLTNDCFARFNKVISFFNANAERREATAKNHEFFNDEMVATKRQFRKRTKNWFILVTLPICALEETRKIHSSKDSMSMDSEICVEDVKNVHELTEADIFTEEY